MKNKILLSLVGTLLVFSSFLMGKVNKTPLLSGAGASVQYVATSTALNTIPNYTALCSKGGTFGGIVVTGAGAANGVFRFYDATTTITNGLWATTTIASYATNIAVGAYPSNNVFAKGLLLEYNGAMGSTTILYSCGA